MLAFLCCIFVYLIYVISVVCVWLCPAHILFTLLVLFVCGGVHHISYLRYLCCLCVVVSSTYLIYVIRVVCVWWCPAHVGFFVLYFCLSYLRY